MSAFVVAAEELHLGRAATRLDVHPATVASRLRSLESRLGLVLIDRSHRCRIALTQAGAALLPMARRAVEAMTAFEVYGTEVREGSRGVVRVALTSEGDAGTNDVIDALRRVDPGWDVRVVRMGAAAAGRAMAIGAVECSVGRGRVAPHTVSVAIDPRPTRLERIRVARIRPAPDADRDRQAQDRLVVAWRTAWELDEQEAPRSGAHAETLVTLVRRLRFLAGGRRSAAADARRRAAAERVQAALAERELVANETERCGAAVAEARARARHRTEVLRRVAEARARGETISPQLLVAWLCLEEEDRRALRTDREGEQPGGVELDVDDPNGYEPGVEELDVDDTNEDETGVGEADVNDPSGGDPDA